MESYIETRVLEKLHFVYAVGHSGEDDGVGLKFRVEGLCSEGWKEGSLWAQQNENRSSGECPSTWRNTGNLAK